MNPNEPAPKGSGQQRCGGCKRLAPRDRLGHMLLLPIDVLKYLRMDVGAEANLLYCRRCRWTQSICALFLCMIGLVGVLYKFGMFK
jgi:hypothetical protein